MNKDKTPGFFLLINIKTCIRCISIYRIIPLLSEEEMQPAEGDTITFSPQQLTLTFTESFHFSMMLRGGF